MVFQGPLMPGSDLSVSYIYVTFCLYLLWHLTKYALFYSYSCTYFIISTGFQVTLDEGLI